MKKLLTALMCAFLLTSCGTDVEETEKTSGLASDATIEIVGEGVNIMLDAEDLNALEKVELTTTSVSSTGEVSDAELVAVSVNDILIDNGVDVDSISAVNFVASDGYVMSAPRSEFEENGIYLILNYNGDDQEYPRSCIPEKRAMYWVKHVSKIELSFGEITEEGSETVSVPLGEVQMFRENVNNLESTMLNNRGFDVASYSTKDYFEMYFEELPTEPVTMIARDGFSKTETVEVFFENYVTLEGESDEELVDTPLYFSETISDGMRVKQLDYVVSGDTAIYFGNDTDLVTLFETIGMPEADEYIFVASDGFESVIPAAAIEHGRIYADEEEGYLRVSFGDYDLSDVKGKGKIKHLAKIIPAEIVEEELDLTDALLVADVNGKKQVITEEDFENITQTTTDISRTNSYGVTTDGTYKGVHWTDLAEYLGVDADTNVVAIASDGYQIVLPSDMINDPNSLFALYKDGEYIESSDHGRIWFCASENYTANNWAKYVFELQIME